MWWARRLVLGAAAVASLACGPKEQPRNVDGSTTEPPAPTAHALPSAAAAPAIAAESSVSSSEPPATTTHVAVLDPEMLAAIEARGFTLGKLVAGVDASTTRDLSRLPGIRSIFDVLEKDVETTKRKHPLAKVTSVFGWRLFDNDWLSAEETSFILVGVFNRLDRRVFYEGTCGEIRFLYRLRYTTTQGGASMTSRLPTTVNVVFMVDGDDCDAVARAWQAPRDLEGTGLSSWLESKGALSATMRERWSLKSVETNMQTIRLQSSVHPTMAGHIDYGMHVFHAANEERTSFAPAPMENMPDVRRLSKDVALKAELLAHLKDSETLAAIDRGTLNLPQKYLATQATSVSPRGLTRMANRPFASLFTEKDFAGVDLRRYQTIRSPSSLLRRLDGASCVGCHQSRSIAGFHHVGMDPQRTPVFNSLVSGLSPHLQADLLRRTEYAAATARGETPNEFRPIPERQGVGSGHGAPCGLGDPGFAEWRCADGLRCTKLEDEKVGVCVTEGSIGAPCQFGQMLPNAKPHRDYVTRMADHACGAKQSCDENVSGFPLGSCASECSAKLEGSVCGEFLDVDGFQNCLRSRGAHDDCAKQFVFKTGLRSCSDERPCRQDFVCARTSHEGVGSCIPPYFVYQLRLDGYPISN